MAGDATIQAAIQDLIQSSSSFADADVSLGDYRILGSGSAPYAIILPGQFRAERAGDWSQVQFIWEHPVEIWHRFAGDDYENVVTARTTVVDLLNTYPTLNSTSGISNSYVVESTEALFLYQRGQVRDSLPAFVGFRLTVRTVEERLYSGSGEFTT